MIRYRFKLRRDSALNWTTLNPVLLDGEPGIEEDTGGLKCGDGVTPWNGLDYIASTDAAAEANADAAAAAASAAEAVAAAEGFDVGTVTTVAPEEPADVTITGAVPDRRINFEIPKGEKGDNNFVVEVAGTYPARPTTEPVVFVGDDNPNTLGLMLVGDTWIDTSTDADPTPTYALVADLGDPTSEAGVLLAAGFVSRGPVPSGGNDTAALNAHMAVGKDVILGDGEYFFDPGLSVPDYGILRGTGRTILTPTSDTATTLIGLGIGAELTGITLNAGATPTYLINTSDRSKVTRCSLTGGGLYGVHVSGKVDVIVERNTFTNVPSYAVLAEGPCQRLVVHRNSIVNPTSGQGVTVKANAGGPTDTVITSNAVDVQGTIGLEVQVATATSAVIGDNVVRNADIGISLSGASGISVVGNVCIDNATYGIEAAQATTDGVINGNIIIRPGTGIILSSPTGATVARNCTVDGNTIKQATTYGIRAEFGSGHVLTGNAIEDSGDRAIFLNNAPNRCIVSNNKIARFAAATNAGGIYVSGSDNTMSGNVLDYSALAVQAGNAFENNGGSRNHWVGNSVYGSAKGFSIVGGTGHQLVGNSTYATTQHSVFASGVTAITIDAHSTTRATGVDIDVAGATAPGIGTVFNGNGNTFSTGVTRFTGATLGFFSVTPVVRPTALTAADATTVDAVYGTEEAGVINNLRTRVGELETKLRALGLLT